MRQNRKSESRPRQAPLGTGLTTWDVLARVLQTRRGRILTLGLVLALLGALGSGWLRIEVGSQGLGINISKPAAAADLRRFEGQWRWTGRNLVPDRPIEYEGSLRLNASRGLLKGEGEYRIVRGDPLGYTPPRHISVEATPDGEYLSIRYQVNSIGVPGSRGFGFMLLYAKPNGMEMDGHFLARSLRTDGFVWGTVNFRK